jgi:hypothetical protein
MMRIAYTLLLGLIFTLSLSAQTVETSQKTLLVKKTATWCPFCGSWGWTMMKGMMDDNEDRALVIGAHYSGDLQSSASADLMTVLSGPGQPVFFANATNLRVNSGNVSAKRAEVNTIVETALNTTARIGVGARVEDRSGTLEVKVKTEFLETVTGDFNVAVLVLENDVKNTQSGRSGVQDHPNVLREAVNGTFGEVLATGTTAAGQIDEFSWSYTPDPSYKVENLRFVAVIWEDLGGSYRFENGLTQDEIEISTSTRVEDLSGSFVLQPNIMTDETNILVDLPEASSVNIKVHDLLGSEVLSVTNGKMAAGEHRFMINRSEFSRSGMYLVSLKINDKVSTKRLLVK